MLISESSRQSSQPKPTATVEINPDLHSAQTEPAAEPLQAGNTNHMTNNSVVVNTMSYDGALTDLSVTDNEGSEPSLTLDANAFCEDAHPVQELSLTISGLDEDVAAPSLRSTVPLSGSDTVASRNADAQVDKPVIAAEAFPFTTA